MEPVWPKLLTVIYCVLIVLGSLGGGWLPSLVRLTHFRMQFMLSFVGGLMLGVGLLHLLPHGIAEASEVNFVIGDVDFVISDVDLVIGWTMIGLLGMFFMIRLFHFHQHDSFDECAEHEDHGHGQHNHPPIHRYSWIGVAAGLSIHTLIDGIALGAAVVADARHGDEARFYGFAVFLAILLHKPFDALSITWLMSAAGWKPRSRQLVNLGFALMCPLGAMVIVAGLNSTSQQQQTIIGCALGFSAGTFLCISLADLLPEVQFHKHDRFKLSLALVLGVLLAAGFHLIEPAHLHTHSQHHHDHDHAMEHENH